MIDGAIAALAERQHGVVSRRQLEALGLSRHEIGHRVACGRLHLLYRGVYAVGHRRLSREGEWLAAVLAGGTSAVLIGESAGALWGIHRGGLKPIHVATTGDRNRNGIRFHRIELDAAEITERKGIPVTTPERTIIDLAASTSQPFPP